MKRGKIALLFDNFQYAKMRYNVLNIFETNLYLRMVSSGRKLHLSEKSINTIPTLL